ncbi:unnamed protein product [Cyprideis torosa]|uniref:Uncharacterized protein n=1 Tax=Cyprideis torosa TaxID=163714 RepID=A0A7R8ZQP4_9CRUS|nr:unnamed protein product [Cyprideis torosa]CAG0901871.1 unnamed protein product [Cyprideis torosa]
MSWNTPGTGHEGSTNEPFTEEGVITLESAALKDGVLTYTFVRNSVSEVNGELFNLANETFEYYVLMVSGPTDSATHLRKHEYHASTEIPLSFGNVTLTTIPDVDPLRWKRAHGILMTIAWFVLAPVGIIMPRFFKNEFKRRLICGNDVWFAIHRLVMSAVVALSILAFLFVAFDLEGLYATEPHHIFGYTVLTLMAVQPVMAFFRPHPGTPRRVIFNWAHWIVGNSAQIFAVVNIFLSADFSSSLPISENVRSFSYAFVGIFVASHAFLFTLKWLTARKEPSIVAFEEDKEVRIPPSVDSKLNLFILVITFTSNLVVFLMVAIAIYGKV